MFYSEQKKQFQILNRRAFFLLIMKAGLFSILGWRLFNIQITNSKKYKTLSKNNQINIEILYPIRGIITDRSGNIIATNIKIFDLYIIPEGTKNINETLNKLSTFIKLDFFLLNEIGPHLIVFILFLFFLNVSLKFLYNLSSIKLYFFILFLQILMIFMQMIISLSLFNIGFNVMYFNEIIFLSIILSYPIFLFFSKLDVFK